MKKKVSAKRPDTGKWWTYGNFGTNQFGNQQFSLRVTPELEALIASKKGEWINFSLFDDDKQTPHNEAKSNGFQQSVADKDFDDDVLF